MTTHLMEASKQWANRPDDERFWTLQEALQTSQYYRGQARQASVRLANLDIEFDNDEVYLVGKNRARLTHYAFGQLANQIGAPANYLRSLPTPLTAELIRHGTKELSEPSQLLFHENGSLVLRAITSDKYSRIWNSDVIERLTQLVPQGWRVPPARPSNNTAIARPATEQDCLEVRMTGIGIQPGDLIAPAGIYMSDHDMFIFMVNEQNRINDGSEHGLSRGVFISNSEVGAGAFKITMFLYRSICGNHIVWHASDIKELKIVHKGTANQRYVSEFRAQLIEYSNASAINTEQKIKKAQTILLGNDKDDVLDAIFKKRILSKKQAEICYDYAIEQHETTNTGDPHSLWGYAQGMTRYSQTLPYADARSEIDKKAGQLLNAVA